MITARGFGCVCTMAALLLLLLILPVVLSTSSPPPVLIWSSVRTPSLNFPPVDSTSRFSAARFGTEVLSPLLAQKPAVIFIQDVLSIEDFSIYGNAYGAREEPASFLNVKKFLDSSPSVFIPMVDSPNKAIDSIVRANSSALKVLEIGPFSSVNEYRLPQKPAQPVPDVFLVNLPITQKSEDRRGALTVNDEVISHVLNDVKMLSSSYLAMYMGKFSEWAEDVTNYVELMGEGSVKRSKRQAAAEPTTAPKPAVGTQLQFSDDCGLMYFTKASARLYEVASKELYSQPPVLLNVVPLNGTDLKAGATECHNETTNTEKPWAMLTLGSTQPEAAFNLDIRVSVTADGGYWGINEINVTDFQMSDGTASKSGTGVLSGSAVVAPIDWSFACVNITWSGKRANATENGGKFYYISVQFDELRFQAFSIRNKTGDLRYQYPSDCTGFFSVGIWMSILVCAVLIIILGFGVELVMSIHTTERFDDPKGKALSINATD